MLLFLLDASGPPAFSKNAQQMTADPPNGYQRCGNGIVGIAVFQRAEKVDDGFHDLSLSGGWKVISILFVYVLAA